MTKKKSTTKATARQEPRNIPTKPGFYWVKVGYWQPCEVRDLGANGLRVWFVGVPQAFTLYALGKMNVEWGPEIEPPVGPGWRFVAWKGKLTGTQNPVVIAMDGNKPVTAVFEQAPGAPATGG